MIVTILIAVFIFGLIILIHEFGHYCAARISGITIIEFAIGMGPVVFSRTDKLGIRYSLRLLPIGGFLAMAGEDEENDDPHSYHKVSALKRGFTIVAGAACNLICGYLILLIIATTSPVGTTTVAEFDNPGQGSAAVLQINDEILKVNGKRTYVLSDVSWQLFRTYDGVVTFTVRRDGQVMELPPVTFKLEDQGDGFMAIGIDFRMWGKKLSLADSFGYSAQWSISLMKQVWGTVSELFTGNIPMSQLSGPIGVASAIGEASKIGITPLLMMTAMIMINIGLVNLLPLPALDGGKLVLIIIEGITGFKFPEKLEFAINTVGLAGLMMLMVYITFNDVQRFFK